MTFVIGIDARAAVEVPAGRGRYVRELLKGLARIDGASDVRFELWARSIWDEPSLASDSRFQWRLVSLPDPIWHLAVAAQAGGDVYLSTNSYLTAWATRVPTAVVVYDLVAFLPGVAAHTQRRATRIERATIRPALRRAAALPCISDATRFDLEARFPSAKGKAVTIPLAADRRPDAGGHPRLDPTHGLSVGNYVLAVGTLEPRKNLERLVDAWSGLPPDLRLSHPLALVGPRGWDDSAILEAAHVAGARLLGHVTDEQLLGLYANASCFAYPSLYEGFGLPVLEAMAAGAPVLTSNISSLPEVAGDAALLVNPLDVSAISTGLHRLLTDPTLTDALRLRGAARAERFSWDRTASETLKLLRGIARTH
jgi:alpha-1,3-rhamnosyl/mannosyltransferase